MSQNFANVAKILMAFQEAGVGDADLARIANDPQYLGVLADTAKTLSNERRAKNHKLSSLRNSSLVVMAMELPEIVAQLREAKFNLVSDLTTPHKARFSTLMLGPDELQQVAEWLTARGLKLGVPMPE